MNKNYPQILGINADFSFLCVLCVSAVHYFRRLLLIRVHPRNPCTIAFKKKILDFTRGYPECSQS